VAGKRQKVGIFMKKIAYPAEIRKMATKEGHAGHPLAMITG
jgi:hypothetical protein